MGDSLLIAVSCVVGDLPNPVTALLDTAATWSVLPSNLAAQLGQGADEAALAAPPSD